MSENIAFLANNSQAWSPPLQNFEKDLQMHTKKETASPAANTPESSGAQKKAFLRSGSGLKRRQEASTSEKRYVPKGGFILDFSESPDTGSKASRTSNTPASSARLKKPEATTRDRGEGSNSASVTPSRLRPGGEATRLPASSKTQQSTGTARSSLAGRPVAPGSGSRSTGAKSGSQGRAAPGRATAAAGRADQAAKPAAGLQQPIRPSMRRPGPPGAASLAASLAGTANARPAAHAHSTHQSSSAEALHSAAEGQADAAGIWADVGGVEAEDSGAAYGRTPSQGVAPSEEDAEEFGAGVDWDEDAPMLPDQDREPGAALGPLPAQVSSVKDGVLLSSGALSPFVQQLLFGRQVDEAAISRNVPSGGTGTVQSAAGERHSQSHRAQRMKLKAQVEQAAAQLEKDKQDFQHKKAEEMAAWEKAKEEEKKKLQRERLVLNKQSRALLKLPSKKDRAEMEALEATLAEERRTARAKEARHKLIVERLRRQIVELQEKNAELREETRWHEEQRLKSWAQQEAASQKFSAASKARTAIPAEDAAALLPAASSPQPAPPGEALPVPLQQPGDEPAAPSQPPAQETDAVLASVSAPEPLVQPEAATEPQGADPPRAPQDTAEALLQPQPGSASCDTTWGDTKGAASSGAAEAVSTVQQASTTAGSVDLAAILTRPQRPPAKPLPPVPRFDRWDFGRGAAAAAGRPGAAARLGVECSSASAPAFHHAALSPFLDDLGSEAVYSPLRASMRASGAHNSFGSIRRFDSEAAQTISRPTTADMAHATLSRESGLAAGSSLSRGSSLQLAASVDEHGSAAPRPSEEYNASAYERLNGAASEQHRGATGLQSIGQPELASCLQSQHSTASASVPGVSSVAVQPQQAQLQPSKSGVHSVAGSTELQRAVSGHGLAAPGLLAHGSVPVKEMRHPDGKLERIFGDGRRAVMFPNGTLKEQFSDGRSNVCFSNGDVKRTFHDGMVEYYYAEVDTWHTTHPDGVEVFYFPSGQTETHHPGGLKEIVGPTGLVRLVHPDGKEEDAQRGQLSGAAQRGKPSLDSEALAALRLSIGYPAVSAHD